jgi:hypothetical protein
MEKNTKIILGLLAVGTIAYLTREKWMPKSKSTSSDSDKKSEFRNATSSGTGIVNKVKDPCATHTCPNGCTKHTISNGKCGCKCSVQGSPIVWY